MIACRSPVDERPPSIFTLRGIGYGPRSDSSAYSKETRVLRCFLPTTVTGIPIGAPSQSPEPKSAWTLPPAPIERTISSEYAATGNESTRWFHGFDFGKTGQRGAEGIFSALAVEPPSKSVPRHTNRTARLMDRLSTGGAVRPRGRASPKGVDGRRAAPSGTAGPFPRPCPIRSPGAPIRPVLLARPRHGTPTTCARACRTDGRPRRRLRARRRSSVLSDRFPRPPREQARQGAFRRGRCDPPARGGPPHARRRGARCRESRTRRPACAPARG